VASAAMNAGLAVQQADYVPCYRTEAGTGSGMGFVAWV
jgi:3-O-methylgallate 3,4-dioxygenase